VTNLEPKGWTTATVLTQAHSEVRSIAVACRPFFQKKLAGDTATPLFHPILMQRKGLYDVYKTEILVAIPSCPIKYFLLLHKNI